MTLPIFRATSVVPAYGAQGPPDVTDPTVNAFSPADDATGVSTTTNLVITFLRKGFMKARSMLAMVRRVLRMLAPSIMLMPLAVSFRPLVPKGVAACSWPVAISIMRCIS